jgi:hypothetical protein
MKFVVLNFEGIGRRKNKGVFEERTSLCIKKEFETPDRWAFQSIFLVKIIHLSRHLDFWPPFEIILALKDFFI